MNDMPMTETALTVIPAASLPTIIAADKDDILGALARKVAAFKPDISTPLGRDEMRSLAYEIARTKTKLDNIGKSLGEDAKKTVDAINAERRILRERLEELQGRVREPLTEWENAETKRVEAHEAALAAIVRVPGETAAEIAAHLDWLRNMPGRNWQEFAQRAADTITAEISRMEELHARAEKREAEAAELDRLRAEAAERAQREREERIAAEAAETARKDAEAKAAREAEAAERKAQAERDAAARKQQEAQEAIARAERDRKVAEDRAKATAEAAERAQKEAAQRAELEKQEAIAAERRRAEQEAEAKRRADDARTADTAHRAQVNRDAFAALVGCGLDEATGKTVIAAIAKGKIPFVSINY